MKLLVLILGFCFLTMSSKASDPYRDYLLSKIYLQSSPLSQPTQQISPVIGANAIIPHYETPRGAVFCRMEDKVIKATKVWLKLGVQ